MLLLKARKLHCLESKPGPAQTQGRLLSLFIPLFPHRYSGYNNESPLSKVRLVSITC